MHGGKKMAIEVVKEIMTRAATDNEFREVFFNPETIDRLLDQYKGRLTPQERKCLQELTPNQLESYSSQKGYAVGTGQDIRI